MENGVVSIPASVLASVADAVSKITQSLTANYTSVTDDAFARRLENAMEKNLNYIRRKDNQLLNSAVLPSVTVPPPPRPPTFLGKPPNRLGIGANTAPPPETGKRSHSNQLTTQAGSEPVSVYVSNLPVDITEEELEILFGALGKIKKVKLYTTPLGHRKGDALVTFSSPECASTACHKFNGLDIGEGHVISVVKAEFNGTTNTSKPSAGSSSAEKAPVLFGVGLPQSSSVSSLSISTENISEKTGSICKVLPPDSEAGKFPVLLILNSFDPQRAQIESEADFFDELEADMLLECCKFGKVRGIQLLNLPVTCLGVLWECMSARIGNVPPLTATAAGAIAVTFSLSESAELCAGVMGNRKFDGRQLITHVLLPQPPSALNNTSNIPTPASSTPSLLNPRDPDLGFQNCNASSSAKAFYSDGGVEQQDQVVDVEAISSNVDDFLNSLL